MRESYWEIVYQKLLLILSARGKDNAFGQGDFWLLDDDWGEKQLKICIFNPDFLTPELVDELKNFLSKNAPDWSIIIVLEIPDVAPDAMVVSEKSVEYLWDVAALRKKLGNNFFSLKTNA